MTHVLVINDHAETGGMYLVPCGVIAESDLRLLSTVVHSDVHAKGDLITAAHLNALLDRMRPYATYSRAIKDVQQVVVFCSGCFSD